MAGELRDQPPYAPTVTAESQPEPAGGIAPDDALARRFRIDHVIGRGGMGLVLAAHHLALDQRVALKLMLPELRQQPELVRRFLREARTAARLTSPHSARIIDVGTLDDGAPYLVLEYLDGTDIATLLRREGAMSVARAATVVLHASRAIGEAHALGIIHRDLKPSNLFILQTPDGKPLVKVLDLGVCKLVAQVDELFSTSSAVTIGTPAYMAPEQLRSAREADARSDIWSLGVILYELLTGVIPFRGQSVGDQCLRASLDPLPALPPEVPRELRAVIERCLEKDAAARFQHAAELASALEPFTLPLAPPAAAPRWRRPALAIGALLVAGTAAALLFGGHADRKLEAPAARLASPSPPHARDEVTSTATAAQTADTPRVQAQAASTPQAQAASGPQAQTAGTPHAQAQTAGTPLRAAPADAASLPPHDATPRGLAPARAAIAPRTRTAAESPPHASTPPASRTTAPAAAPDAAPAAAPDAAPAAAPATRPDPLANPD